MNTREALTHGEQLVRGIISKQPWRKSVVSKIIYKLSYPALCDVGSSKGDFVLGEKGSSSQLPESKSELLWLPAGSRHPS